jgi:hypothetical protein
MCESFLVAHSYFWGRLESNQFLLVFGNSYRTWLFVVMDKIHGSDITGDLLAIAAVHIFFYFREVYPELPLSKGKRPFGTPRVFNFIARVLGLERNLLQF